ncbi:hypothetical protein [Kitasatospora sp. NPDC093558]|uniref:hypothetical protein n=1 Tax=Kitasatospora sp. NPDC093558 TaxID=3155201 RepID=UPI003439D6F0
MPNVLLTIDIEELTMREHDSSVRAEVAEHGEELVEAPAAILIRRLEKKETTTASNSIGN